MTLLFLPVNQNTVSADMQETHQEWGRCTWAVIHFLIHRNELRSVSIFSLNHDFSYLAFLCLRNVPDLSKLEHLESAFNKLKT